MALQSYPASYNEPMSGKFFWIIFLLLGAWQIVGSLIERANKKQQEAKLRELASHRQKHAAAPTATTPPGRPADRAEALAARRRAQLEELRRRRAGRQPRTQITPGVATPQPGPAPTPAGMRTAPRAVSRPPARRPAPPAPPTRTAARFPTQRVPTRPTARPPAPPVERQPEQTPPPVVGESEVHRLVLPDEAPAAPKRARSATTVPSLSGTALTPTAMRRLILLREVLDPPVSLREHQVWERV